MKPEAEVIGKRVASAQRTQAEHSRTDGSKSNSSQEPRASGKPDAVFSSWSDEPGNQFVLCSNMLIRQNWEDLFLKVMNIPCSVIWDLNLCSKNIQLDVSISLSMSFSNKLLLKDWNYRTPVIYLLNLDENKCDCKKNWSWKKNFSKILKYGIFMNWEKMKRAQQKRVDEFSVQNLRENHDTIQKLTSQLQSMQEQMNSMNHSGG